MIGHVAAGADDGRGIEAARQLAVRRKRPRGQEAGRRHGTRKHRKRTQEYSATWAALPAIAGIRDARPPPPKAQSVERAMGPENWRGSRPMVSARIVVQMRRSSVISQGPTPTLEESHVKGTSCRSTPGKHGAEPGPCRPGSVQSRAYEADGRDDC